MKKFNERRHMLYLLITILLAITLLSILTWRNQHPSSETVIEQSFVESDAMIANPLMGFAPRADKSSLSADTTLVYINVFWSQLEPQEGEYDWETIEATYQFARWKSEGKHAVFRFIMDYPREESHIDIPEWLYNKTGDGTTYDNNYGQGYSPNYKNPDFISAYENIVTAMGERWGQDSFISFVELGGLGHWGEWHTNLGKQAQGSIPDEYIRDQYVDPWLVAFPKAELMMRRPFNIASEEDLGLFNDVFGSAEATDEWLDWIQEGGAYNQTNEEDALAAMPSFWKTAPSGGEIASSVDMTDLLTSDLETTLQYLEKSHTTFLGPKIADSTISREGYNAMHQQMGYRLWISEAKLLNNNQISLTWQNSGVAPFYWRWPVKIYVQTPEGTVTLDSDFDIRKVLPEESQSMKITLDKSLASKWQSIHLAIQDPMTGQDAIHFAIDGLETQTRLLVLENRQEEES